MDKKAISNTFTVNTIDDAVTYGFVFTEAFAKADASKTITGNIKGYAYKYVGGKRMPLVNTVIRYGYIIGDDGTYADTTTSNSGFFDTQGWFNGDNIDDYAKGSPSIFAAIQIDGVIVHVEYITISLQGDTGGRGKMGRNLWFAGWWDDVKGTNFSVNDYNAPYVQTGWADPSTKKIPVCKVFIGANGNFTYPSTVAGYENNVNWGAMVSDFEYLITKAVFAALAKLGSWTFNSDFMYSDKGLNHSTQQESAQGNLRYDGIDDSDNTWTPNVSIDAANGRASFGRDKIRFNPNGSGWLANKKIEWNENGDAKFSGTVNANLFYGRTLTITTSPYTIDPSTNPYNMYLYNSPTADRQLYLPNAATYDGLEINVFVVPPGIIPYAVRVYAGSEKIQAMNNYHTAKDYSSDHGIVVRGYDAYASLFTTSYVVLRTGVKYTFKSINGTWYVIDGLCNSSDR